MIFGGRTYGKSRLYCACGGLCHQTGKDGKITLYKCEKCNKEHKVLVVTREMLKSKRKEMELQTIHLTEAERCVSCGKGYATEGSHLCPNCIAKITEKSIV